MECGYDGCSIAVVIIILISFIFPAAFCTSSFISSSADSVFVYEEALHGRRNLLQTKKACPVNFEIQNYTIITSQCKGPEYPPKQCCNALLQFACPYAADINAAATDCADAMFSYINLYGKYPPGLFAHECRGDKLGLRCPQTAPAAAGCRRLSAPTPAPLLLALVAFLISVTMY